MNIENGIAMLTMHDMHSLIYNFEDLKIEIVLIFLAIAITHHCIVVVPGLSI
jgi:hypothetical protein